MQCYILREKTLFLNDNALQNTTFETEHGNLSLKFLFNFIKMSSHLKNTVKAKNSPLKGPNYNKYNVKCIAYFDYTC